MLRALLRLLPVAVLMAWQLALADPAQAKAGDLDRSFGVGGRVITDFGTTDDEVSGVMVQADGKPVAAGFANEGTPRDFALARYKPDGTLDTSFGRHGKVSTDFAAGGDDGATTLAAQPDGRLVAGGLTGTAAGYDWILARYRA